MKRANRLLAICGGILGALAAFALAKLLRPLLPVPSGGVGFVTVHRFPKSIDTVRYLLLLALIPAGALIAARRPRPSPSPGLRPPSPTGGEGTAPRAPGLKLLVAILFLALRVLYSAGIHGPVDLFHAGHYLSPAADALAGRTFFRDSLPFHGLMADGALDAVAFRWVGETVAVSRGLRIGLDLLFFAIALAALASLCRSAYGFLAGAVALALLTSAFRLDAAFPYFRTLPLLLAAALAARSAATGSRAAALAAGVAAGAGAFWSLDTGLFAVAGVLALALLESSFGAGARRGTASLAGLALGFAPGAVVLLLHRALGSFARDSWTILRSMDAVWGLPAPAFGDLRRSLGAGQLGFFAGEPLHFYLPVFFFGAVAASLLLRTRSGRFGWRERVLLVLLVFSVLGFRTALGRASYSHTRFSMVVPSLLLAAVAGDVSRIPRRRFVFVGAAAAAFLFAVYGEAVPAARHAWSQIRAIGSRWSGAGLAPGGLPRWGNSRTTPEQAASLEALFRFSRTSLPPGGTLYDFSNSGALYFFLERANPTRLYEASCLSAGHFEKEAIADLSRVRPGFVVVAAPGQTEFDGVPNEVRAPAMAAWIRANYPREIDVGGFRIRVP